MNIRRLFLRAKSVAEESPASQAKAKVSSKAKPESDSDSSVIRLIANIKLQKL